MDFKEMAAEQNRCPETQRLLGGTSLKWAFHQTGAQRLACDISTGTFRPIIPLKFRKDIFAHFHNVAHPGRLDSRHIISFRFVWRGLSSDVTVWATSKQMLTTLSQTVQSKDCTAASRTPFAHASPRRLGLRSYLLCTSDSEHSRGKTLVFPRLRQFLALPLCCLMNFCILQNEEMSVDAIINIFSKTLHVPAVSLPRHNSSAQLPEELPGDLLSAPLVWVCRRGVIPPLQLLYDGPYVVLRHRPRSFTIRVGSRDEVIAVSHLKACTATDATPGSPRRGSRPPGSHPGGPAATKQVSFLDPLVSSPSPPVPP